MHNGTVPYFKQVKRSMLSRVSERAFHLIQGTTDSEMMFALFVTNFEKLTGFIQDECNTFHQDASDGLTEEYEYIKNKEDMTSMLAAALKATLRQVHYICLQYEYNHAIQTRGEGEEIFEGEDEMDGASERTPLPYTKAIGRLNLAVSDGQSTCTARYATSSPETAHSLYYCQGSRFECENHVCQVLPEPSSPCPAQKSKSRAVVVTSEPLAPGFKCDEVPVNHMIVSGPDAYFSLDACT